MTRHAATGTGLGLTAATGSIDLEARRNTGYTGAAPRAPRWCASHDRRDSVGSLGVLRERLRSVKSAAAVTRRCGWLVWAIVAAFGNGSGGCVDTTLPELGQELGGGPTDAAYCATDVLTSFPAEELRIHVIDVGQGDAIWVQTPWFEDRLVESLNVLIDTGSSGELEDTSPGGDVVVGYLQAFGLVPGDLLHAMVVTHAHEDHYGGAQRVARAFDIGAWVDPGFAGESPGFLATRSFVTQRVAEIGGLQGWPAVPALAPAIFRTVELFGPYVEAQLLWSAQTPPGGSAERPTGADVNNTSVAFALRWAERRVLLMGDLEARAETELIAAHDAGEIDLRAAVLKVSHHGSDGATSEGLLARVFPAAGAEDWAVISSGRRSFGGVTLPGAATLERLGAALLPNHVLSTERGDGLKRPGTEHNDDHVLVRIRADGLVEACYVP